MKQDEAAKAVFYTCSWLLYWFSFKCKSTPHEAKLNIVFNVNVVVAVSFLLLLLMLLCCSIQVLNRLCRELKCSHGFSSSSSSYSPASFLAVLDAAQPQANGSTLDEIRILQHNDDVHLYTVSGFVLFTFIIISITINKIFSKKLNGVKYQKRFLQIT